MTRKAKRALVCVAIVAGSVGLTLALSSLRIFQLINLKAQDANFLLRGTIPPKDIVLVGIDNETNNRFPELSYFWHKYYADAMRGAAEGGAKVMVLDVTFGVPVTKYEPDFDAYLAQAFAEVNPVMPVVTAYVPEAMGAQAESQFAIPLNMMSSAMGSAGYANLTNDQDDFVRRQELIEEPKAGTPTESLARSLAFLAVEKFTGKQAKFVDGQLHLGDTPLPVDTDRFLTINYAGPPGSFPRVPLYRFIEATRKHDVAQLQAWVKDKLVLLGPDNISDRHDTPFYTFLGGDKYTTPGFEIHASTANTLLSQAYLRPVPEWARLGAILATAAGCVAIVASLPFSQTAIWSFALLITVLGGTHASFRTGWLFATSEILLAFGTALLGGIVYRFATAERKSSFFKTAVELFVGKQVATSLDQHGVIALTGERQLVTILFTDIRGFTSFCESRDPAVVVDLLNEYLRTMVSIIVKNGGHVNKFIGDGILAVFADTDPGARPGDHAVRTARCATEMVDTIVGDFRTGAGFHSGEVVIGNVGSSDKMEFTVLGDTVNVAARLESLNKEKETRLLMSVEAREMLGGLIDTICVGSARAKGKSEELRVYTVTSLLEESRIDALRESELKEAVA